ncbi:MAG: hypothetical protein JW727_06655 [Candidatus Aenigmarchaeota archaeon]|nr:hypothetical protein [Candidatus Aenigmarchaeota archaeon]
MSIVDKIEKMGLIFRGLEYSGDDDPLNPIEGTLLTYPLYANQVNLMFENPKTKANVPVHLDLAKREITLFQDFDYGLLGKMQYPAKDWSLKKSRFNISLYQRQPISSEISDIVSTISDICPELVTCNVYEPRLPEDMQEKLEEIYSTHPEWQPAEYLN